VRPDVARTIRRIGERRGIVSTFSPEVGHRIVMLLAEGQTLKVICDRVGMPSPLTVRRWRDLHSEFDKAYCLAQETGHDVMADECIEIADDADGDSLEGEREDGSTYFIPRPQAVQRSKLRITTRLDILERRDARYSKRQNVQHSGSLSLAALIDESYKPPAIEGSATAIEDIPE
jgi:transposase-like protein